MIRDPLGSIEEQREGISLRQVCEGTLNMLSFGNLWNAADADAPLLTQAKAEYAAL